MLVLTRKEGEQICIGNDIVITVVRGGNDKIRLGIEAPKETVVLRSELTKRDQSTEKGNAKTEDSFVTIPFERIPAARCS